MVSAALIVDMAVHRHQNNLILLVVVIRLVGFIGSVTVARFVIDGGPMNTTRSGR